MSTSVLCRSCIDCRSVKGMTVDDFLGAGFMENESDDGDVRDTD